MILIFAGVHQGKLSYALERFKLTESDIYRCDSDDINLPENKKVFYEIDKWVLALLKKNIDIEESVRRFIDINRDAIVICNDISCGVVPADPVLRKWRDAVGKSLTMLSHNSHEVIRLFCGIPTRIA
jgi:adenosyl cobinamide kinase/adenosyl cobinamide phosphate guanylyltransferase